MYQQLVLVLEMDHGHSLTQADNLWGNRELALVPPNSPLISTDLFVVAAIKVEAESRLVVSEAPMKVDETETVQTCIRVGGAGASFQESTLHYSPMNMLGMVHIEYSRDDTCAIILKIEWKLFETEKTHIFYPYHYFHLLFKSVRFATIDVTVTATTTMDTDTYNNQ